MWECCLQAQLCLVLLVLLVRLLLLLLVLLLLLLPLLRHVLRLVRPQAPHPALQQRAAAPRCRAAALALR